MSALLRGGRDGVWHVHQALVGVLGRGWARWARRVSVVHAARLKQELELVGRLDYPGAEIRMVLESAPQVRRLRACRKEPETLAWLERTFRPGDVLYDVGANVGAYSLIADALGRGRSVIYAFEPSYSTFAALSRNVGLNACGGRVIPFQVALAAQTGLKEFRYASVEPGASLHGRDADAVYAQPVLTYRLDDFVRQFELRAPTHLKLDVDGGEAGVLAGAGETLDSPGLRTVLVEIDDRQDDAADVRRRLEKAGFAFEARYPRGEPWVANYIFGRG